MAVRKGLGRGLDAMISETASKPKNTVKKESVSVKRKKQNQMIKICFYC